MDVIPALVLCSLALVACALVAFLYSVRQGDHEHADRLSLLPLEDDAPPAGPPPQEPTDPAPERPDFQ